MVPSAHTLHYSGILNARQTGLKLDLWCKIPLLVRSGHTEPTPACSDGSSELQLDEHVHKDVHKLFGALGCSCMGLRLIDLEYAKVPMSMDGIGDTPMT